MRPTISLQHPCSPSDPCGPLPAITVQMQQAIITFDETAIAGLDKQADGSVFAWIIKQGLLSRDHAGARGIEDGCWLSIEPPKA